MQKALEGKIVYEKEVPSKTIRRFVEKKIHSWADQNPSGSSASDPLYLVAFRKQGGGHMVLCQIQIQTDRELWRASAYAAGVHQAFLQCLKQLMRFPSPTPPGGTAAWPLEGQAGGGPRAGPRLLAG